MLLLGGCEAAENAWQPCAHLLAEPLKECSGIVHSRRTPGVFWVHNDSGDLPRLFAVDADGALLAELHVEGADHVDWEDITADDQGNLYIGDFGNNANERTDLVVYVVPEPQVDPRANAVELRAPVSRRIPFYYPEQRAFPDRNDKNYDCEAMYWDAGSLYLLTKHRSDLRTVLYRIAVDGDERRAAERVGEFDVGSQVTAADLSADGRHLVVLSYEYIYVFERPTQGDNFFAGTHHRVLIEGRQCEGISFDGGRLVFTNEQREMYCMTLDDLLQRESFLPETPTLRVPRVAGDASVLGSSCRVALHAGAGVGDARPAGASPPALYLGWSERGLHVSARWADFPALDGKSRKLMQIMVGPPGSEPRLGPGQIVYEVRQTRDAVRVRRAFPKPKGAWLPGVEWDTSSGGLEFHALIPAATDAGGELGFNAIAFVPGRDLEWCWSASSSAQPERNPVLWGRLTLQP